jgi:serine-type D-Ala-D-Ala carboxypeptidase/endopeptidase (penicillin-binding protein 4)
LLLALAAPAALAASSTADRDALRSVLQDILDKTVLGRGRVGILVSSLDDGKVVFAHDADELLNPASNVKLFTSAAALVRLGPDYRFETEFLTRGPLGHKGEAATLYVRGKGDPSIITERLWTITSDLFHQGLRSVPGDIVIDDTYFDGDRIGPGFDTEHSDRAYAAPTGAVALNWNAVAIHVYPADSPGDKVRVEMEPPSDYFVVENHAVTVSKRSRRRVFVSTALVGDKQRIIVSGRVPADREGMVMWKKIDNPPAYFGYSLKAMLGLHGIAVKGRVKSGATPPDAKRFYVAESDPLDLIIRKLNKTSSNFIAEQLVKTLGAQSKGAPGSWPKGVAAVEEFLDADVGIPRGSYVMKNGSGLNDTNRFSSAQVVHLLTYMQHRFPLAPEYLSSLGIAGHDGTVKYRMDGTEAAGRLRAKTGTLENVTALSGYCQAVGGEKFVFSIIANDFPARPSQVATAIDAVGASIAAYGSTTGPAAAYAAAMGPAPQPGSMEDLKVRIPTYVNLGKMADKRNVAFLRTALRAERDPALKAVVAESLYLSDRQDIGGVRALLDAFQATSDDFGRLKAAARDLSQPTPVIGSIADLAAEGNSEAMAKLIDASALCGDDEIAKGELADAFEEVGRTAPEELIAALRVANEVQSNAALDLIAKGLSAAADPDHPLPNAIRQMKGSADEDVATYGRMLDASLSTRIALEKVPQTPAPISTVSPGTPQQGTDARPGGG